MQMPKSIIRHIPGGATGATGSEAVPITKPQLHCVGGGCPFSCDADDAKAWDRHVRECVVQKSIRQRLAQEPKAPRGSLRLNGWMYGVTAGRCERGHVLLEGVPHRCSFPAPTTTTPVHDDVDDLLVRLKAKGIDLKSLVTKEQGSK